MKCTECIKNRTHSTKCSKPSTCGSCKCKPIMCDCVQYNGTTLPQSGIIGGDTLCEALSKIDSRLLNLVQRIIDQDEIPFNNPPSVPEGEPGGGLMVWSADIDGVVGWRYVTGITFTDIIE